MAKIKDVVFSHFYSRYNPPPGVALDCSGDPGRTRQEFKDESDINNIMAKYLQGREFPVNVKVGRYDDFASVEDFQAAQNLLIAARSQFEALPVGVRVQFNNNPAAFLEFVKDKRNYARALELGLLSDEAVARERAKNDATNVQAKPAP